jgi:Ca-activated chloride channel homolog
MKIMLKSKLAFKIFLLCLIAVLSACSDSESASTKEKEVKKAEVEKEKIPEAADDVEDMINEGPGFALEKEDEEIKKQLEKYPKKLKGEDAYNLAVFLGAAEYQKVFKLYDEYNPGFNDVEGAPGSDAKPRNLVLLLDSSGSMNGKVDGGVKMDLAKQAISNFASKANKEDRVMLRVYGHKGTSKDSDKNASCESHEVVYPLSEYDQAAFSESLNTFKPAGWTPIAGSIQQVEKDLAGQANPETETIVYIISDGVETCDGDPVEAARALHNSSLKAQVNIIGFDVDDKGQQQLKATAEAGGGEYKTVRNASELNSIFKTLMEQAWEGIKKDQWAANSGTQVNYAYVDKLEVLNELKFRVSDVVSTEGTALKNMISAMEQEKMITLEEAEKARAKVNEREEKIKNYNEEKFEELKKQTDEEKDRVFKLINEASQN